MKKHIILTSIILIAVLSAGAQDYKVNRASGKMLINLSSVTVEGYGGNEIVFSSQRAKKEEADPRAEGLRIINGAGSIDNTGLGISVVEKGTSIEVSQVVSDVAIKILVPKNVILSYAYHKVINSGKVVFKDMENEIEISTDHNSIELDNVTGPMSVNTIYGSIEARFNAPVKGPVSIASIHSLVDVAIPADTKANVKLSSSFGSILASPDLKIELEKNAESGMVSYGSTVNGKLNGGGAELKLASIYGKVYLRKTK